MKYRKILLWGGWILLLALSVLWRLPNIDAFGANNDEGAYLMWARLVAEGYPLYSQTQSVSAPLFIEMLAMVFRLFGFGVVLGRMVILSTFVLTAGVFAWLSHRIAGWVGAYVSLGLLAILPLFYRLSRQVMAEIPATLFGILAITFAYIYFERKEKIWLGIAGISLALSLATKTLYPAVALSILYFIWRAEKSWYEKLSSAIVFGLPALLTLVLIVTQYPWEDFFDQVVLFRNDLRIAFPLDILHNWSYFKATFNIMWGILILASLGGILSIRKIQTQAWILWFVSSLILVLWQTPLFWQHFVIVLPPLILLSVEFIKYITDRLYIWKRLWARPTYLLVLPIGILGIIFLGTLINIPGMLKYDQKWLGLSFEADNEIMILHNVTRPTDFVISDSQILALFANRLTPPPMGDIAHVAIISGRQTASRLIDMSKRYQVQAIVPWTTRLDELPEYINWAEQNFFVHGVRGNQYELYFGRKHPAGKPIPNEQSIQLSDGIAFRGYSIDAVDIKAGEILPVTLYWQSTRRVAVNYTIFVQILNSDGILVAQKDSQPIYGYYPTSKWVVDEIVPDRMDIPLPSNLPFGEYRIITGMYDLNTMRRLTQKNTQDFIKLGTVVLEDVPEIE